MADILSFLENCSAQKINQDSKRRLQKHVQSELSYLNRAASGAGAELASVSSNLNHLKAVASLLKLPAISCVVGIFQTISFQKKLLSAAASSLRDGTELCTTAVDLVCLFRGEPAWMVVSARNPDFVSWETPGNEWEPFYPLECPQGPTDLSIISAGPLTTPGSAPSSQRVLSKQGEVLPEVLSADPPRQAHRPRPTHDTCLKERIAGLLDAARGSSELHRPSRIVLCFARGLRESLQMLLVETFGAVPCPELKPVGFEISVNPDPYRKQAKQSFQSGEQLLASPAFDISGKRLSPKMAPDSEALAWSLIEGLPSPTCPSRPRTPLGDVTKGADGVSKEWIVLEDPSVDPVQDGLAIASGKEEANNGRVVVSGGLTANRSGVRGQVMDLVRQLENENERPKGGRSAAAGECTEHGQLKASQTAPGLETSFVAIDGPEGSFEMGNCQGQEDAVSEVDPGAKSPAALENGWVAVRLGADVPNIQSSNTDVSSIAVNGSRGDDKEWVALSSAAGLQREALAGSEFTGGCKGDEQGGQWVGVQQPGLTTKALKSPRPGNNQI